MTDRDRPQAPTVPNIGPRGRARRRAGGIAWLVLGVVAAIVMVARHAPAPTLLLLLIPFFLGALGVLQARAKT